MFGIPVLWNMIITKNRKFVYLINAYGKNIQEKWYSIVSRLKTTGIFLFAEYKPVAAKWSVIIIVIKFIIMLITSIASHVNEKLFWFPSCLFHSYNINSQDETIFNWLQHFI